MLNFQFYMRLMKSSSQNEYMVISQAAKRLRPTKFNIHDHKRRTDFSFALANMIQMTQDKESQLILQTKDITKRLEAQKLILTQAGEVMSNKLIQMNTLTAAQRDEIRMRTFTSDYDDDILPADYSDALQQKEKDEWDINNVM